MTRDLVNKVLKVTIRFSLVLNFDYMYIQAIMIYALMTSHRFSDDYSFFFAKMS